MSKKIKLIFKASFFLYLTSFLILWLIVDHDEAQLKILNHLRNSARYINDYANRPIEFQEKKFLEAVDYSERIVKFLPELKMSYGVLGFSYSKLGDYKKSISAYKKASEFYPNHFGFQYNIGINYMLDKQWAKAHEVFQASTKLRPESSMMHQVRVGKKIFKQEEHQRAWSELKLNELKETYDQSIKLAALAKQFENQGRQEGVEELLEKRGIKLYYYVPLFETGIIPLKAIKEGKVKF